MKVNLLLAQFPVTLSIQENLKNILLMLEDAQPGDIVVFPEGAVSGYAHDLGFLKDINKDELSAAFDQLRRQSQARGIYLWVGSLLPDGEQWFNAALGFTPGGGAYQYRKINLATHERGVLSPGADLPVFELETPGGSVNVGVQICREIRFPEQWGWLARQGAQVFLHLNNAVNEDLYLPVWRSHLVSHAASNQRYVVSVNNAGATQGCPTMVVSPQGLVMAEIVSDKSQSARVELDLTQVSDWYLRQSRQDLVNLSLPSQKERRKILRSMRIEQLAQDLDEVAGNPDLYQDSNLALRTEALELVNLIEDMHRLRSKDKALSELHQRGIDLRQQLEQINNSLFSHLRGSIMGGDCDPGELRDLFNLYTDYRKSKPGKPHYGYDDLDSLVAGIFLAKPAPDETLERQPGMVRYQPTPASVILELVDQVGFSPKDTFFDLGSGLGQVVGLVNLLAGVPCVGVEYQPAYYEYAGQMADELGLQGVTFFNADAQDADYSTGTVFFMFNPFGGRIFDAVMDKLRLQAQTRVIRICSYGSCTEPISQMPWLEIADPSTIHEFKLAVFESR